MGTYHFDPHKGLSAEDRKKLKDQRDLANKIAAENWDNPTWRREMAAEMTETIYYGFQHENLLSLFANVENLGFDDRASVKNVRGLRAHWVARGGHIEASTLHSETFEIPRDTVGFQVYEFEDKLRTNFAETQSNLVNLGMQRLDAVINQRVFAAFQAAVPSSHASYISASGLSLTSLNLAIRQVRDESMEHEVALVGRSTMTEQIMDQLLGSSNNGSGFIPETNEALVRLGVIGNYRGARIITLLNYKDDMDIPFFPANELWVIGPDASKFAFFGGLLTKEWVEQDNWYWHYLVRRDMGGIVYRPNRLRRIIDTSISATYGSGGTFF